MSKVYVVLAATLTAVVLLVWLVFSWFEADTEIRVLCGSFHPGRDVNSVLATLETGEYLRYRITTKDYGQEIYVDSLFNLRNSNCLISSSNGKVTTSVYNE